MSIIYRKLTENDLETFIGMRIVQLREEGATEDLNLVPALRDYYQRHMADGTFVSWLAIDGERIIGTSGMHGIVCFSGFDPAGFSRIRHMLRSSEMSR